MKKNSKLPQMDEFFAGRGFGKKIGFGKKPSVLVVDLMNAFTDENHPLGANQDTVINNVNKVLRVAREKSIPIFFGVVQYNRDSGEDAGIWQKKSEGFDTLNVGSKYTEIDERLERKPSEHIIAKKYASCFFGTDFVTRLNVLKIDTLIVTGVTTSGCVRATVVDAVSYGFRPIVVAEAVNDRAEKAHEQSLFDLEAKYADVVSLDDTINYLTNLTC